MSSLPRAEAKPSWLSSLCFAPLDFLLAGIVITFCSAYWLERSFSLPALLTMSGIILAGHGLAFTYVPDRAGWKSLVLGRLVFGNILSGLIYLGVRRWLSGVVSPTTFAELLLVFAVPQIGLRLYAWRRKTRNPFSEPLRGLLLLAALLVLHRPLLTNGSFGAGDAYWYSIMVADFAMQWREGIFPVLVGQTEFAFNGAISPLRFAPALQHLAGVVDLATARSLPFYGILNLTLLVSFVGGALSCYLCLRAIEPRTRWLALILSLLYSWCPGLLALAYVGDLFMSVTAIPYVPVLLYGIWRTLTKGDRVAILVMVAAAAALWHCHPPIALWGTLLAFVTQLLRLPRDGFKRETWIDWSLGLGVFLMLTFYCFTSVYTLNLPPSPSHRGVLVENLMLAFPAALWPVSQALTATSDYQLGWTLWFALLVGGAGIGWTRPRLPVAGLLTATGLLLVFILPSPWLKKLWFSVPQVICDITYMWPMQRFYVLLAALAVFMAFIVLAPLTSRRRMVSGLVFVLLLVGLAWSEHEAQKFRQHAYRSTTPPREARRQHLSQNRILTRYAFNSFREVPPYYSHGFIDPLQPNRLLAPGTLAELASNRQSLADDPAVGPIRAEGTWTASRPDPAAPSLRLTPDLRLEPGRRYTLKIDFAHPEFTGALAMRGPSLARQYWMPDSAYDVKTTSPSRAFSSLPGRPHNVTLWTERNTSEEINFQFFFHGEGPSQEVTTFGHYTLREFDPAHLPIRIEQWAPYRARVHAPSAAYLETPRLFLDGYRARVNGRQVLAERSPDALVMIPVPAGENVVELSYVGPPTLRFAYFLSLGGWLALFMAGIFRRTVRRA